MTESSFVLAPRRILVPTDFGPASKLALRYGSELAGVFGAALHVLHTVADVAAMNATMPPTYIPEAAGLQKAREQTAKKRLRKLVAGVSARKVKVTTVVVNAPSPASTIVSYSESHRIDLIVMGTHGRSGVAQLLLGSVADKVVRSAPCPVMTVRHPEKMWPRTTVRSAGTQSRRRTAARRRSN